MNLIENNINDILDVQGKNNNFLTDKPFSEQYKQLASKWSQLPMYKDKSSVKKFFDLIHNCQVILLISGTGSGKTVLVPKFFLKYIKTMGLKGKIAITNPKILTTIYNAEYGAKTLDVQLGEEVGYRFKGSDKKYSGPNSKLLYVTDGLILATILSGDTVLSEYQGIIIDEAHERHVQIDMILRLIKEILPLRPDFKLIIMSATINAAVFRNYFNTPKIKFGEMEVSGESNFPITQNWLDPKIRVNRSNYLELAIRRCLDIVDTTETGDIIIFVPTQNDAIKGCQMLKDNCPNSLKMKKGFCEKLFCIEVYSKMKQANKDLAVSKDLYKSKGFERKVIFATNVAESSITFDGLVYVVDSGFELANYYEVTDNSFVISKQYTSQAQIKQRIGRAGRTQPGVSYHLYTQMAYNGFKLYPEPNISVIDLTDFVLSLVKYSKTIHNMIPIIKDLITVPKIEQIAFAIYKLQFTKCLKLVESEKTDSSSDSVSIDLDLSEKSENKLMKIESIKWSKIRNYDKLKESFNGALTGIGLNVLRFKSSSVLTSISVLMSKYMNCLTEICQLSAILEISDGKLDSLFEINRKETDKVIKYFSNVAENGSDHLTILNIYKQHYLQKDYNYLNKRSFDNIEKRTQQLLIFANSIDSNSYEHMKTKYKLIQGKPYDDQKMNIQYIIAYSNYYNMLFKESNNIYTSINYIENSVAPLEYFILTPPVKVHSDFAVCHSLSNVFGRKSYQCLSQIPNKIIKDIFSNEDIYFDHLVKYKQYLQ